MRAPRPASSQRGAASVELAIVFILLLTIIFGVIELARAMYLINTLQDATRRAAAAAAVTDFRDSAALDAIRQAAIFRQDAGTLPLGAPITDDYVTIDYLAESRDAEGNFALSPIGAADLPSSPARNKLACMADPHDEHCIRFVRVRICAPGGGGCDPVPYQTLVSLVSLPFRVATSTTIVPAESLGYLPGSAPDD